MTVFKWSSFQQKHPVHTQVLVWYKPKQNSQDLSHPMPPSNSDEKRKNWKIQPIHFGPCWQAAVWLQLISRSGFLVVSPGQLSLWLSLAALGGPLLQSAPALLPSWLPSLCCHWLSIVHSSGMHGLPPTLNLPAAATSTTAERTWERQN